MSRKLLDEFLDSCRKVATPASFAGVETVIKKKFQLCNENFKNSPEFSGLIRSTQTKILNDDKRVFVYIRDFVTELKAYGKDSRIESSSKQKPKKKERSESPNSELKVYGKESNGKDGRSESSSKQKAKKRERDESPSSEAEVPRKKPDLGVEKAEAITYSESENVVSESKIGGSPYNQEVSSSCSPAISPAATRGVVEDIPASIEKCEVIDLNSTTESLATTEDCHSAKNCLSKTTNDNADNREVVHVEEEVSCSSPQAAILGRLNLAPKRVALQSVKLESDVASPSAFRISQKEDRIKASGSKDSGATAVKAEPSNSRDGESTPFLEERKKVVNERLIRKLEKLLAKLRNEIEKVKERELTMDDLEDDDSSYIYEDRLQKKFVKVWNKLCEVKGRRKTTGRPTEQRLLYEGTRYPEINKKIERFINNKKMFPDYHDIRDIIIKVNKRKGLNLSSKMVEMISRDAFTDVGNRLQERRKEDFRSTFGCSLTDKINLNEDPALKDAELKQKLEKNRAEGKQKLEMVISKFSHEQYSRGEEPVEVNNQSEEEKRESSCSPTNEEEEEPEEEEVCVPELDEVLQDMLIETGDENSSEAKPDQHEEDELIELSTDEEEDDAEEDDAEEEDDAQSDDEDDDNGLPKTFASVLEHMQAKKQADGEVSDDKMESGKDDDDDPIVITDSSVYMDVADDSDAPSISELSPVTVDDTESSDSEASDQSVKMFKSPERTVRSTKLSIRTPQKSLLRKALGLKSPGKTNKVVQLPARKSVELIEDERDISSSVPSTSSPAAKVCDLYVSSPEDISIVVTPESSSVPLDDPIISSSTGEPRKGGNDDEDGKENDNSDDEDDDDDSDIIVLD